MAINSKLQERIKQVAAELRSDLWGEKGYPERGTKFDQIEDECREVADALARELMGQGLNQQETAVREGPKECGHRGRHGKEDGLEPKRITTRRGDVVWRERKYYCKHCRKAFFPSGR
jgi:hypothetical protein